MGKAASLNPESFTEGGGLIDDVDMTVSGISFVIFDYNGKVDPGVPAIRLECTQEDGEEYIEHYSAGKASDWLPSEDGSQLVAVGQATGIRSTTKAGILLKSLVDSGFPVDQLGDDIKVVEGLQAHFIRVPAPKRQGLKKAEREDGRVFEETVLVISEILSLPGDKKKPAGAPKGKSKAPVGATASKAKAKTSTKESAGDVASKTAEVILEILEESGVAAKKDLPAAIFKLRKDDPDRNEMVKMAFDEKFLGGNAEWNYEDGNLIKA